MGLSYTDEESVATEDDKQIPEVWELTIPGRVSVNVHLAGGLIRNMSRQGEGQRLRISAYDRKIAQEGVRDPNNDAFTNGMLVRVDQAGAKAAKAPNELTDTDLAETFKLDDDDFVATLDTLTEVNVRRLKRLTRKFKATAVQVDAIDATIDAKWKVGGDMPSNKEARGDK